MFSSKEKAYKSHKSLDNGFRYLEPKKQFHANFFLAIFVSNGGWSSFALNPFQVTGLFLYPLKTSENQRFSDVFGGYRKRPVAWSELIRFASIKAVPPQPRMDLGIKEG